MFLAPYSVQADVLPAAAAGLTASASTALEKPRATTLVSKQNITTTKNDLGYIFANVLVCTLK